MLKPSCLFVWIKCGIAEHVSRKDINDDGRASFFPVGYYSTVYLQTVSHFLIFGLGTLFNCLPLFRFSLPLRRAVLLYIDIP